ncbi:class I adenylate-forming enzyme family protein [Sphingomonas tabacisoli]|uniref:Class I adenylate-forming enzyme family protein n=1 Tax=Sphingomonas tabacisoli TaxID=2249466 RepID=A0ABW4I1E8_9SPHN
MTEVAPSPSLVRGPPLEDEPGLGALTLPGYLREVTERFAAREAVVFHSPHGVIRWDYATLWDKAVAVAKALIARGLGKDGRVGILMSNRPEWLAATFGISLAGGVAVPLSTFSTRDELEHLLAASDISVLLLERTLLKRDFLADLHAIEPALAGTPPFRCPRFPYLRRIVALDHTTGAGEWQRFLEEGRDVDTALVDAAAAQVRPSDTAVLFFSSGSTRLPKGILSAHRGVAIQLWRWARIYALEGDLRCWAANGLFWSGVFGMALGMTFSAGGAIVLQPTFAAEEALQLMEREKVNVPLAWAHQWARLAEAAADMPVDLSSLRYLDSDTPLAAHPTVPRGWKEPTGYGVTETFTICVAWPEGTPSAIRGTSHGEVLPGNTVKIVDPLTGTIVPRGISGEIVVRGPTLMLNYVGIPAGETLDAEGYFHTGDGGHFDESGRLFWEGRLDDIIKTGGANVSPAEVDAVLATCPGVKLASTVGVPHDTRGEMVVACIVAREDALLDEAGIRTFLNERLASYKVPRRVLFLREEELPLTGSAKVKLAALRDVAQRHLAS